MKIQWTFAGESQISHLEKQKTQGSMSASIVMLLGDVMDLWNERLQGSFWVFGGNALEENCEIKIMSLFAPMPFTLLCHILPTIAILYPQWNPEEDNVILECSIKTENPNWRFFSRSYLCQVFYDRVENKLMQQIKK